MPAGQPGQAGVHLQEKLDAPATRGPGNVTQKGGSWGHRQCCRFRTPCPVAGEPE